MNPNILVYGAGGAAKDIIRLIEQTKKWTIKGILVDDEQPIDSVLGYKVLGDFKKVELFDEIGIVIANGSSKSRKEMLNKLSVYGHVFYPNIIHPSVQLHRSNRLSKGIVIDEGVIITSNVTIGDFTYINIGATISHDCQIGCFVTISPKVAIAGNVDIQNSCFIGINATIIEKIHIDENVFIAAGAVVINNMAHHHKSGMTKSMPCFQS